MQQVWPINTEIEILDAYQPQLDEKMGFLRLNMVASLDGAISHQGRSRELSSEVDRKVFHAMRSMADVILVGSNTMKIENYKSAKYSKEVQEQRLLRSQLAIAPIAVVTSNPTFDWESDFFIKAVSKPIIFTTQKGIDLSEKYSDRADFYEAGSERVDLTKVKNKLVHLGLKHILCEGGPILNSFLLENDLVDELCLTTTPKILQGLGPRIFNGAGLEIPKIFTLTSMFIEDGQILARYSSKNL